jgi:SprT protein
MLISSGPDQLSAFLLRFPESTRSIILEYINKYSFYLKITNPRKVRLGSFKASLKGHPPVISINNDLGHYSFMLVFLHELAHLEVWLRHGRRAKAHGMEWKQSFRLLCGPLLEPGYLPTSLVDRLHKYFILTHATFQRDINLLNILGQLEGKEEMITVREIPENAAFRLSDGRIMVKQERLRTRYRCYCPANKRYYLVPGTLQIIPGNEHS